MTAGGGSTTAAADSSEQDELQQQSLDTDSFGELRDKNEIIRRYVEQLNRLRRLAANRGQINDAEFNNYLVRHYFHNNNIINYIFDKNTSRILLKTVIDRKKKIINFIFILLTLFIVFSYKHEVSTVVLRNIQSFIYPGMRVWRKVTVPIIASYPSLTEYYDESCLLTNPYFQVENLNCDPCADVANVLDFTTVEHAAVNYPYIFKVSKHLMIYFRTYCEGNLLTVQSEVTTFLQCTHQRYGKSWKCLRRSLAAYRECNMEEKEDP